MRLAHSAYQYHQFKMSLYELDEDIQTERNRRQMLIEGKITFRVIKNTFLKKLRKQKRLRCIFCQKKLKLYKGVYGVLPKDMATLEHLVPLSFNGLKYTESNFGCSCSDCNNKRDIRPIFKISDSKYIW